LARFLAIDWDHQQLHVVAATVSGGTVRIRRAAAWVEPQAPNPAEAEALGRLLRERLKAAGIAAAPVLACLGRDRVILKEVRHPPVPAAEEPAVVRFQAVKELTEPPDEVVIDYTPAGGTGNGGERRALVLVVRRELLQAYQTVCQAAGLKLAALTPRSFGTAAGVRRLLGPEQAAGAVAVLTLAERWGEFCVLRDGAVVFARSVAVGPTLPGEVRRNLAVYAGQAAQHPVQAVYVAGAPSEHAELRERLRELAGVPVQAFDPFAPQEGPELPAAGRGAFAGAAGLLHAQAGAGLPINFVRVKQPGPQRDPHKRRLVLAAAVAGLLVAAGIGWCWKVLADRDAELQGLNLVKADLDRQLVPLEEDAKYLKGVGDWTDNDVVWIDELYDLADRFPRDPNLQLIELQCVPEARVGKEKYVAAMTLTGIAADDRPAKLFEDQLKDDSRYYRVNPMEIGRNTTGVGGFFSGFQRKFTVRVDVEKRPATEYRRVLTAPAESEGRRP
jgi:Tfp pilus assembly PilM family ATPase